MVQVRSFSFVVTLALLAATLFAAPASGEQPLVDTTLGPVRGTSLDGVDVYLGIPYAAPPTRELRWRPPVPPQAWSEPLDALDWPVPCPQLGDDGLPMGDEDCLSLNVWSPQTDLTVLLPVMVFMHGGGNMSGTASKMSLGTRLYDGADLARSRGVVVVTIQYRLGALGFLAHPAFAAESPHGSSGNYGLLDQQAALRWVQDNIHRFRGDPTKVLLFGESAGATDTLMQLVSPLSEGLFSSAVMESGGDRARPLADQYRQAWDIASVVGCGGAGDPAACLRGVPAHDLVETPVELGYAGIMAGGVAQAFFEPTVDGWVIPAPPRGLLQAGLYHHVPVILGANADETLPWVPEMSESAYEAMLWTLVSPWGARTYQDALALYPVGDDGFATPREAWSAVLTDVQFVCPIRRRARTLAATQTEPVYLYLFQQRFDGAVLGPAGAFHGAELWRVFQHTDDIPGYQPSTAQIALQETMGSYWSHLALSGNPNSQESPPWPLVAPGGGPWLVLDDAITVDPDVRADRCRLWDRLAATLPASPRGSLRAVRRWHP